MSQAAASAPISAHRAELDAALALHRAGRFTEAERSYRRILAGQPDNADALHLLGLIAFQGGKLDAALELIGRSLVISPKVAVWHYNLGEIRRARGELIPSLKAYSKAIELDAAYAEAHQAMALALAGLGRSDEAVASYRQAVRCKPGFAVAWSNLGNLLADLGRADESLECYQKAVAADSQFAIGHSNLANALRKAGRVEESAVVYERAIALNPKLAEAHHGMGTLYLDQNRPVEALACYEKAIALEPDRAEWHWGKAMALLVSGQLRDGFAEYEWRYRMPNFPTKREFDVPRWAGEELGGRAILLWAEQGCGDAIQFVRYAPMVAQRGGRVIVECRTSLKALFSRAAGVAQVVSKGDVMPPVEAHAPLMSLPAIFGTELGSIPRQAPYLLAETGRVAVWQERLGGDDSRAGRPCHRRVGLVWAGRPTHMNDRTRSCPLSAFAPIAGVPGVRLYSLQLGDAAQQRAPEGMELIDHTAHLGDFADTAAFIANLDLVISVDTAAAHLAGALGKPVWLLLRFTPEWRWLLDRGDSPWYPTMRIFRQASPGDWANVIDQVAGRLHESRVLP